MASIILEQVFFRYPDTEHDTIQELSLQIENGEAHALLGASGTGKTTLLNLLSGLLTPTAGRIVFGDRDVSKLAGRARNVAQVFQFPVLYESMTVAQNLGFAVGLTKHKEALRTPRVIEIAQELGIEHLLERKAHGLGLFEKQLVAVGKALVRQDTTLVLLDEPLTAVEPKIKWQLRQTLLKAQKDLGLTMVYVTHDQTEALTFADRVSVLTESGIVQTGTPQEIYQAPAHQYVGHFVGSPGMNYLPAHTLGLTEGDTVGFRPEWVSLQPASHKLSKHLEATVVRVRTQGTEAGQRVGLTTLRTHDANINVFGALNWQEGQSLAVTVNRYVLFKDQRQVSAGTL